MMDTDEKRAVLIGMHRSGTAAVAGAAHLLGAEAPKHMIPAATDNPSGCVEAITVLGVNDWIPRAGDSTWFDCLNFDPNSLPPRLRSTGRALVNFSLIGAFENASLLLLADPRLFLLLDYWLAVLQETNIIPAARLVLRDPDEVIASLMRREQCPAAFWVRYMIAAEHATRGRPRSFIRYDASLDDWRNCMARVAEQAAIEWRVSFDMVAPQMRQFLDRGLRHHRSVAASPSPPGSLAALLTEAYRTLLVMAEHDGDAQRRRGGHGCGRQRDNPALC